MFMDEHDLYRIVIENTNWFMKININLSHLGIESYVLPIQHGLIFNSEVPHKLGWSYVMRYESRRMDVKYIVLEEYKR